MTLHRSFSRYIYWPFVQKLKRGHVASVLSELSASQWLSQSEVLAKQWQLVQRTVAKGVQEVPYYREVYTRAGWDPQNSDFTYEEFLKLPKLEKEDLRDRLSDLLNPNYHGRFTTGATSGSTGQSVRMFYSAEQECYSEAARWRAKDWWDIKPGNAQVTLWGRPYSSYGDRLWLRAKSYCMNNLYFSGIDFREESLKGLWEKIRSFKPEIIYGYATTVYSLAAYIKKNYDCEDRMALKVVMITGESVTGEQRSVIEEVFNCKVANEYGSSETGGFVYECSEKKWHISSELTFLEFLNPEGAPVSPGETGEIFLTHLRNDYMPLIRYRVGDMGSPLRGLCSCGRGLPLMGISVTKHTDVIRLDNGGTFSSQALNSINTAVMTKYPSSILQFRVKQKMSNRFDVEIVPGVEYVDEAEARFAKLMKECLGDHIIVNMKRVSNIERERSGKLRYFVPEMR